MSHMLQKVWIALKSLLVEIWTPGAILVRFLMEVVRTVEKAITLNSYVFMNNVGRNVNIIGASDETSAKNKEHVIRYWRKGDPY